MSADTEYDLDAPYRMGDPLDMGDARKASRRASQMRRDAEALHRAAIKDAAEKEGTYRQALAKSIVTHKVNHGSTVAKELAHEDADVKKALVEYKIAEGMVQAWLQRLRTLEGERSMLKSLIDWSATIANVLRSAGGIRTEDDRPPEGRS